MWPRTTIGQVWCNCHAWGAPRSLGPRSLELDAVPRRATTCVFGICGHILRHRAWGGHAMAPTLASVELSGPLQRVLGVGIGRACSALRSQCTPATLLLGKGVYDLILLQKPWAHGDRCCARGSLMEFSMITVGGSTCWRSTYFCRLGGRLVSMLYIGFSLCLP